MVPIRFMGKTGVLPTPSTLTLRIERRDESAGEALMSLRFTAIVRTAIGGPRIRWSQAAASAMIGRKSLRAIEMEGTPPPGLEPGTSGL